MKRQNRFIGLNRFFLYLTATALWLATGDPVFAQLNLWTNNSGGKWEDPSWSLGAPGDSAVITNAGTKAIIIGPSAWTQYPESFNVRLHLWAPSGSTNRLLLAPETAPIQFVGRNSMVGTNGWLENRGGHLSLVAETHIDGTLVQRGGNLYSTEMHVSGKVLLTNVLSTNSTYLRIEGAGEVTQSGGTNQTAAFPLSGTYRLLNGLFSSSSFQAGLHGSGTGYFLQSGGRSILPDVELGTTLTNAYFVLSNGIVRARNIGITTRSEFTQYGGNLIAENMTLGVGFGGGRFHQLGGSSSFSSITLQSRQARINAGAGIVDFINGSLKTGYIHIGGDGHMNQHGGHLSTGNLGLTGWQYRWDLVVLAYYDLTGGVLLSTNQTIHHGIFRQAGGSNYVASLLQLSGRYGFSNNLASSRYELSGGSLNARIIDLDDGCTLSCAGATSTVRIINQSLFKLDGFFHTGGQSHRLGVFVLSAEPGSYSGINLGGSGVLRFANSSSRQWTNGAKLQISGWVGATNGAGGTRLFFGTNSSGLTAEQLEQIEFSGSPAEMLSTGEVVPWRGAELVSVRANSPNGVHIVWRSLSSNVKNFEILRRLDGGAFSVLARVGPSITHYVDRSVHSGLTYHYAIKAYNPAGAAAQSTSMAVTLPVGLADNLVFQHTNGQFSVWVMQTTNVIGNTSLPRGPAATTGWRVAAFADLNGDSNTDIVWQNNNGSLMTWLMRGTNIFRTVPLPQGPARNTGWLIAGAPDISGDRKADLLWRNRSGANRYWEMNQTNFVAQHNLATGPGWNEGWQVVAATDLNRNGSADLIWSNTNGTDAVWLMDRTVHRETISLQADSPRPSSARLAAIIDLDGDRDADLIWEHGSQVQAWLMQGTNYLSSLNLRTNRGAFTGWRLVGPK